MDHKGKLVYAAKNDYKLDNPQASTLGYYNYKAGNKIKVYKEANEKSKTAFTMKRGQRFCANKIHVVKWSEDDSGYYTGGGSVDLPAWG